VWVIHRIKFEIYKKTKKWSSAGTAATVRGDDAGVCGGVEVWVGIDVIGIHRVNFEFYKQTKKCESTGQLRRHVGEAAL
jgi:hypothetical protein